ncbi:hypothetical protein B0H11DRAFT_2241791 [Mycena galericulata]|nr:hypothetical protein B0H11DRAFT_2241791 [Mycena galericulata]
MSTDNTAQPQHDNANGGSAGGGGGGGGVESGRASVPPAVLSAQQAQLAALLSFKPSSRDVISGIAPHVFDDQRSPYRPRHRRRSTSPDLRPRRSSSPNLGPRRSPLRLSAVIVDENGAIVQPKFEESIVLELCTPHTSTVSLGPVSPASHPSPSVAPPMPSSLQPANEIKDSSKRRSFRIDRVLKTLVFRLK